MAQATDALKLESIQVAKTDAEILADQVSSPDLTQRKQTFIINLLDKAAAKHHWRFLFNTLDTTLQFELLHRLLGDRLPSQEDWINLFRHTDYDFRTRMHYRIVLTLAGVASGIAVAQMVYLPLTAPERGLSWFGILPAVITTTFWLFLWHGIEQRFEGQVFRSFSLLGVPTFFVEVSRLFKAGSVWVGISSLLSALSNSRAVAVAGTVAVAGLGFWARAAEKDDIGKYLAILSFPFFCWFPITLIYATLGLLNVFTWPIIFTIGTWCWVTGQRKDRQARNPLQGILPDHYNPNYKGQPLQRR